MIEQLICKTSVDVGRDYLLDPPRLDRRGGEHRLTAASSCSDVSGYSRRSRTDGAASAGLPLPAPAALPLRVALAAVGCTGRRVPA
ncbi:hypothetical protein [Paenibacillus sp. GCM10027626]|uniref:hypothetical protein n=1 Tax=Paenibacillus sp. GCM10027626 TaxID=3273411 RepID=UPI00364191C0